MSDNQIDLRKLSPAAVERMRVIAQQSYHKPLDEEAETAELDEEAMRRLRAEAARRGVSIYEVIEWVIRKSDV